MSKIICMKRLLLFLLILPFLLTSCMKDSIKESYSFFRPVYQTKDEVKAGIKNAPSESITQPGKIVLMGHYLFLNDIDKGIHIIDISNPAIPKKLSFINIPGCVDIAINGNYLYADCYTDLVTLDISNPQQVSVKQFLNGVFPHRYYDTFSADTSKIIQKWVRVDTSVTTRFTNTSRGFQLDRGGVWLFSSFRSSVAQSFSGTAATGISGSTARFGLQQNRMYTVSNSDLKVFNVTKADAPSFVNKLSLSQGDIETIFPYKNNLFIGSQTGMFIYSALNPDNPQRLGQFTHVRACDPVIADDDYAYVTLSGGSFCGGFSNQLDVVNIKNLTSPQLLKTYQLKSPKGLSKDGNTLFICDGTDGLKVFDATSASNITLIKTISGFEPHDVIAYQGYAIAVAKDGIYMIDYQNLSDIKMISKLQIAQT